MSKDCPIESKCYNVCKILLIGTIVQLIYLTSDSATKLVIVQKNARILLMAKLRMEKTASNTFRKM